MIGQLRRRSSAIVTAVAAFIIVILVAAPQAQQQAAFSPGGNAGAAATGVDTTVPVDVNLLVGRSTVLNVGASIARVSLTVPDIADALVTAPGQLLIHGKQPGTISLFVWDKGGAIKTYEVTVRRDLSALAGQLKQLFPGEPITAVGSGKDVVLSGTVSSKYIIEKAADVAGGYVEKKENVVNLLQQLEGVASNQVMLRVRFAEVSRSALEELGASIFTGPGGFHDYVARATTQQFPSTNYDELTRSSIQGVEKWGGGRDTVDATGGKQTFSDLLNLFVFNNRYNVGTIIRALQEKGLFQSLAEPNLIATNGKEASFLAGGEYPYPVVQPGGAGNAVSITFKEFGIRLNFTPTVLGGDLINLKVKPEVSALDFANAVTLEGFRVPALSTRRTETEVELRDGQTFAIAGLMNNVVTDSMRKIPGIGDIPILGWLFKSKAMQKNQTELVVMISPTIIKRGQMGVSESLPNPVQPYMTQPDKVFPNPNPYTGSPRYPANRPAPKGGDDQAPPAAGNAAPPAPAQAPVTPPAQSSPAPLSKPAAPLPSTPVSPEPVPLPPAPAQQGPPAQGPDPLPAPLPAAPTKDEIKRMRKAQEAEKEAAAKAAEAQRQAAEQQQRAADAAAKEQAAADKKRDAEAQKKEAEAQKKADADKRQADKLAKERAAQAAEVEKKNQADARRQQELDTQRDKAINDAAARLKAAQDLYDAEVGKGEIVRQQAHDDHGQERVVGRGPVGAAAANHGSTSTTPVGYTAAWWRERRESHGGGHRPASPPAAHIRHSGLRHVLLRVPRARERREPGNQVRHHRQRDGESGRARDALARGIDHRGHARRDADDDDRQRSVHLRSHVAGRGRLGERPGRTERHREGDSELQLGIHDAARASLLPGRQGEPRRRVHDEERGEVRMRLRRLRLSGTSGQSLIEFAMVTPLLITMALGLIEAGFALYDQHVVTRLTREGSNLISRDVTLDDAAAAMKAMSSRPVDFTRSSKLIFSVVKRVSTTGSSNYDKLVLYQRYEYGTLAATSAIKTKGGGSFGPGPTYEATNSDSNTGLQVVGAPASLAAVPGGMVYITEIYTSHPLLTPFDKFGVKFPTTLYSIAYF